MQMRKMVVWRGRRERKGNAAAYGWYLTILSTTAGYASTLLSVSMPYTRHNGDTIHSADAWYEYTAAAQSTTDGEVP